MMLPAPWGAAPGKGIFLTHACLLVLLVPPPPPPFWWCKGLTGFLGVALDVLAWNSDPLPLPQECWAGTQGVRHHLLPGCLNF